MKRGSAGGKATAKILRGKALEDYYSNPNYCKNCGEIIRVPEGGKVQSTRRKRFCNRSCAAIYNNSQFSKRKNTKRKSGICKLCGNVVLYTPRQR